MTDRSDLPAQAQIEEMIAALSSGDLLTMLRDANERYAYEDEFLARTRNLRAPVRKAAWTALDFSRRVMAHEIASAVIEPRWYTVTPEILRWLHEIDVFATGSLASALERLGDDQQRFATHALMDEAVAACLAPDEQAQIKDIRLLLRHGLKPQTRTERLVVNFYLAMQQVPKLAVAPITVDTVIALQRMLSAGFCDNEEDCIAFRKRNIPPRSTVDLWPGSYAPPLAREVRPALSRVIGTLECDDPWVHPLVRGPMLYFSLLNIRPFEVEWVGLARAVFQVYMHRSGYPALQLMPISQVLLDRHRDYGRLWPADNAGDLTGFVTWSLENIWHALESLRSSIDIRVAENERLRAQLRFDPTLNHRQRTILGRAIRLPGATFFIDYHRRSYDIAYSTARADLMGLVDRGYMRVRRDGHAYVFSADPGLKRIITQTSARRSG